MHVHMNSSFLKRDKANILIKRAYNANATFVCHALQKKLLVFMKSSFAKCVKHHYKKWACNANTKFIDCVL